MINEPIHVTDASYEQAVLKSELPVVVDFWASWCGPCKMIAPLLEDAAKKYAGQLIVAKIDIDEDSEVAEQLGIQSIPTLLYVREGEIVDRTVGSMSAADLDKKIQEFLA